MGKNKMEEFVKLLNIKIGEYFKIRYPDGTLSSKEFYFNKEHLIEGNIYNSSNCLSEIINGRYEIVKLPYKPKKGDVYYSFAVNSGGRAIISRFVWNDSFADNLRYCNGLCYITDNEAYMNLHKAEKILNWEDNNG